MSLVETLHAQHKERRLRFAAAASRHMDKGRAPADILSSAALERALAKPKPARVRRGYETASTHPVNSPMTWRIMRAVSEEFELPVGDIISARQQASLVLARYVLIGLILRLTKTSLPAIARRLRRDHTTVMHGRDRLEAMLLESEAFRNRFDQIAESLA